MEEPVYCTRESIMAAPDIRASAYAESAIDEAAMNGARAVDTLLHRIFYPLQGSWTFDWPNEQDAGSYRLWLDDKELISLTSVVSGGVNITSSVLLEPFADGPPYRRIDIDRATGRSFSYASGIGQRSLVITGLRGYSNNERRLGTLSTSINASVTTIRYAPSTRPVGVGHTLRLGTERLLVNEKRWVDSTQTGTLAASNSAGTLAVANGGAFVQGEELLLDSERLLITAIAGNQLIVRRAWNGTTLAAHTGAAIFYPRDLDVTRGALGTTAAAATNGDTIWQHVPPSLVTTLNRAYALDTFFQEGSGYARTIGSGEGERQVSGRAISLLEERVYGAYGRRYRMRAV